MKNESAAAIKENALEMHVMRIFDDPAWVGYKSFNGFDNYI